jgi:hypothetical protein
MNRGENKSCPQANFTRGRALYNFRVCGLFPPGEASLVWIGSANLSEFRRPNLSPRKLMLSAYIFLAIGAAAGFLLASVFFTS